MDSAEASPFIPLALRRACQGLHARGTPFLLSRLDGAITPGMRRSGWLLAWELVTVERPPDVRAVATPVAIESASDAEPPHRVCAGWFAYESGYAANALPEPATNGRATDSWWAEFAQAGFTGDDGILLGQLPTFGDHAETAPPVATITSAGNPHEYASAFDRIQHGIREGEIYQANLTYRLEGALNGSPVEWFFHHAQRLRPPFARLGFDGSACVVCLSPEELVSVHGYTVRTGPIKGTRRAYSTGSCTQTGWPMKDRAEHVMIVDLARNDLGRIPGASRVRVDPMMATVRAGRVEHLQSVVHASLARGVTVGELMGAVFPGGSVTGAPKRQAMHVIGEVESTPRGVYCGAMGFVWPGVVASWALPIRTAVIRSGGKLIAATGGGIVADSRLDDERQEAADKLYWIENVQHDADLESQQSKLATV